MRMLSALCFGLVLVQALAQQLSGIDSNPPECPKMGPFGTCAIECVIPSQKDGKVCCFNGCGYSYFTPVVNPEPEDPCIATTCPVNHECRKVDVVCKTFPCPPQAECVPIDPCESHICPEGQQCRADQAVCSFKGCVPPPPKLTCVPIDPCDKVDCKPGYECHKGQCVKPDDLCGNFKCPEGQECKVAIALCKPPPGAETCIPPPPEPYCIKKVDLCATITCDRGLECRKGSCVPPVEGKCPRQSSVLCEVGGPNKCQYDRECDAGLLCCQTTCGNTVCQKPEVLEDPCKLNNACQPWEICEVMYPPCRSDAPCPPPQPVCRVDPDACAKVECKPEHVCRKGQCVTPDSPCKEFVCPEGQQCKEAIAMCGLAPGMLTCNPPPPEPYCVPNPCETKVCGKDEVCKNRQLQCIRAQCPTIAECVPIDPCATVKCSSGNICKDGRCVPTDPCANKVCQAWEICELVYPPCRPEVPCPPPQPVCRLDPDACAKVECKPEHVCRKGQCVTSDSPCKEFVCPKGQQCKEAIAMCDFVPGMGTCNVPPPEPYCVPNPCETKVCGKDEVCKNRQLQCIRAPCPTIAECVPIDPCATVRCSSGTICENGRCVPIDPCATVRCSSGTICEKGRCVPIDPCATVRCASGTICKGGSCVPIAQICNQPKVTGPCRGYFPRYFYNSTSGACETFIYGGCGENYNNFRTIDECQDICVQEQENPCNLVHCKSWQDCRVINNEAKCVSRGQCPTVKQTRTCVRTRDRCQEDTDCRWGRKCCERGCGKACVYTFRIFQRT